MVRLRGTMCLNAGLGYIIDTAWTVAFDPQFDDLLMVLESDFLVGVLIVYRLLKRPRVLVFVQRVSMCKCVNWET